MQINTVYIVWNRGYVCGLWYEFEFKYVLTDFWLDKYIQQQLYHTENIN